MKKAIIWVLVIGVIGVVVAMRVTRRAGETPARSIEEIHAEDGVPVDVVTARTGTITVVREITGEVSGNRQSTLRASDDYKIAEVVVREGQRIKRGQTLVRYDVDISPDRMGRLAQIREAYENARRQVDRLEPLFNEGAIAESELDAERTRLAIAEADLRNARLELEVVSPIDGVATLLAVRKGDAVEAGDVVAQVAILDSVRVRANVSGETVRELVAGAPVYLDDGPRRYEEGQLESRQANGRLTRVALGADPDTRLFRVEATLDNADRRLRPGLIVALDVVVDQVGPTIVIPQSALLGGEAVVTGSIHEVFVAHEGRARLTSVEVGGSTDELVEVRSGLSDGDRVVVFGANRLQEDARIRFHRVDGELVTAEDAGADTEGDAQ
jgi:membrane fusion protein (multidrug efflux system)